MARTDRDLISDAMTPLSLPSGYVSPYRRVLQMMHERINSMDSDDINTRRLRECRQQCREGNPFPLMGLQWPGMVIQSDRESRIFRNNLKRIKDADITQSMRDAILDKENPVLRLDWWQHIVIAGVFDVSIGEIQIKGNTGAGKGSSASQAINLWYDVYDESRIHLTGRDFSHAVKNIFGEVAKWRVQMTHPADGRDLGQSIKDSERHYISILNPDPKSRTAGEAFSGAHGKNTLYAFDEASAHPDSFYMNATKNARTIIALSNPRTMSGWFRESFNGLDDIDRIGMVKGKLRMRLCVTVGGPDCINVRRNRLKSPIAPIGGIRLGQRDYKEGEQITSKGDIERIKPLIPEQIDLEQFRSIISSPDKRIEVPVFGYGKFPTEDPDSMLILPSWLTRHESAWSEEAGAVPVRAFGLDVARSVDGDSSVLAPGGDAGVTALHERKFDDNVKTAGFVLDIASKKYDIDLTHGRVPVCVDYGGGYGAGVGDWLRNAGVWVIEFHPNGTSKVDPRRFRNLRTEGYATLGQRLDPQGTFGDRPWALPPDQRLRAELVAPEKDFSGSDTIRFKIEDKETLKKKLGGKSPDYADAVVLLWHAVRELLDLNQYFAQYAGELTLWPLPDGTLPPAEVVDSDGRKREDAGWDIVRRVAGNIREDAARETGWLPPVDAESEKDRNPLNRYFDDEDDGFDWG